MRKLTLTLCAVLLALLVGSALAADATGTWIGQVGGPDGGMTLTFHFKQDGAKLTGTVDGPQGGEPLQIGDGKVDGNKISFVLKIEFGGDTMKITHDGTFEGDEMKLNTKMEGGPGGGGGGPLTLKRSK
jgi:opacity protein-like surface antigen